MVVDARVHMSKQTFVFLPPLHAVGIFDANFGISKEDEGRSTSRPTEYIGVTMSSSGDDLCLPDINVRDQPDLFDEAGTLSRGPVYLPSQLRSDDDAQDGRTPMLRGRPRTHGKLPFDQNDLINNPHPAAPRGGTQRNSFRAFRSRRFRSDSVAMP
mmetsp:Transcript_80705/g.127360  ORF Transcript_80705/g.127360 Transcript_80705/m.127360 type:complete len:156 (-) Transcript_80705:182-649(-)